MRKTKRSSEGLTRRVVDLEEDFITCHARNMSHFVVCCGAFARTILIQAYLSILRIHFALRSYLGKCMSIKNSAIKTFATSSLHVNSEKAQYHSYGFI